MIPRETEVRLGAIEVLIGPAPKPATKTTPKDTSKTTKTEIPTTNTTKQVDMIELLSQETNPVSNPTPANTPTNTKTHDDMAKLIDLGLSAQECSAVIAEYRGCEDLDTAVERALGVKASALAAYNRVAKRNPQKAARLTDGLSAAFEANSR